MQERDSLSKELEDRILRPIKEEMCRIMAIPDSNSISSSLEPSLESRLSATAIAFDRFLTGEDSRCPPI